MLCLRCISTPHNGLVSTILPSRYSRSIFDTSNPPAHQFGFGAGPTFLPERPASYIWPECPTDDLQYQDQIFSEFLPFMYQAYDPGTAASTSTARPSKEPSTKSGHAKYRVETKHMFICTHGVCNKRYARLTDLKRHQRGVHEGNDQFKCRTRGCPRVIRGFSRRDKRDSHEKSMHMSRVGGFAG